VRRRTHTHTDEHNVGIYIDGDICIISVAELRRTQAAATFAAGTAERSWPPPLRRADEHE
jgi:hypothetical protein